MFKGNKKKKQVESNILGLRLTQQTKGYLVKAVAQRFSVKNMPENIWQNSEENLFTGDFFKIEFIYLKKGSCICILL